MSRRTSAHFTEFIAIERDRVRTRLGREWREVDRERMCHMSRGTVELNESADDLSPMPSTAPYSPLFDGPAAKPDAGLAAVIHLQLTAQADSLRFRDTRALRTTNLA